MSRLPVRRALVSVWDKSGLEPFVRRLVEAGVVIVSSGGTAATLGAAGLPVTPVEEVTGWPQMLGGRVKTLHPKIHGGILADLSIEGHAADLEESGIEPIDLVVVNLYPFAETAASGASDDEIVEQIDIGGPAMVRAAAKNHRRVGVVVDPGRYEEVAVAVEEGGLSDELRTDLAREAFFRTAAYDASIVSWMERGELPERTVVPLERTALLRYGENPHQAAAAYAEPGRSPWWRAAHQLQGKQMSFNNYLDAEAAWRLVSRFPGPAAVIVKHANPCGVALRDAPADAFEAAWECDPLSAFGGVVAVNRPVDEDLARRIAAAGFIEVLVTPKVEGDAAAALGDKKGLRVLAAPAVASAGLDFRRVDGGFMVQERDEPLSSPERRVVSRRSPHEGELQDLEFAWTVAAHTKSNAIVIARDLSAVGVGAGDQSRVGAAQRAIRGAGDRTGGAVAASDAFLPFRDGLDALAAVGVTAVIEPGGSVRDDEVIAAADEHDIALVFTGRRHFLH